MTRSTTWVTLALAALLLSAACGVATRGAPVAIAPTARADSQSKKTDASKRTLSPFASVEELRQAMATVAEARRLEQEKQVAKWRQECRAQAKSQIEAAMCSDMDFSMQEVTVSASAARPSITNNQHTGLDEGDIVKRHGDILIVLRRGRLFTIGLEDGQLDALDVADAYGPNDVEELDRTWYDELLVSEHTVVVIGYSYDRGGTELGFFDLGANGKLQHRATYHLRSEDYYSSSNYASRLVGEQLVFFTSFRVSENTDPDAWLPALREWRVAGSNGAFDSIAPIGRVFRPVVSLGSNPTVHTMVRCDLAARSPICEATVLLGDSLTVYYASPTAAYAWTTAWGKEGPSRSLLYRIPFDGGPVSAVGVTGMPRDQLAFLEDAHEHLNVVVAQSDNTAMLLRLPLSSFSDGGIDAAAWHYRPIAKGLGQWLTARFVGRYVLVGGQTWDPDENAVPRIVVTEWAGERTYSLRLRHGVERIEAIGAHAVVVGGTERSLVMSAIRLDDRPAIAGVLAQKDTFQSEDRSHAFFYREDGADSGLFGLPIITIRRTEDDHIREESARVLFVRNQALTFVPQGRLDASSGPPIDDQCVVSCLDWYGNARPIFVDDRIFALLGYEIVEGRLGARGVEELRRVRLMPQTTAYTGK